MNEREQAAVVVVYKEISALDGVLAATEQKEQTPTRAELVEQVTAQAREIAILRAQLEKSHMDNYYLSRRQESRPRYENPSSFGRICECGDPGCRRGPFILIPRGW